MKIEMHLHTKESSHCGKVSARDILPVYKQNGYGALVVTDHFGRGALERWQDLPYEKQVENFLLGYRTAKQEGDRLGLRVFLGAEFRFEADNNNNDYLVYGLTEEFFFSNPDLTQWRLKEFVAKKPPEALVYQAHPFRNGCCPMRREYLFGLEVFNGHGGHDNRNGLALQLARMERYHAISGSDAHYEQYLCAGGLLTDQDVNSPQELLQVLTQDAYCLFNRNVTDKNHW